MAVSEVGAERQHVAGDGLPVTFALLERAHREGVAEVMKARTWLAGPRVKAQATNELTRSTSEASRYRGSEDSRHCGTVGTQ